jgi:hypothetical protein
MSETGGLDIGMPDEGTGGASETVREQAAQQFAASQQAAQQQQKEEKKAKKRDTSVADVILQFLTDSQKTYFATLIARLVAIDCPTTFILAVLSLINEQCRTAAESYLKENMVEMPAPEQIDHSIIPVNSALTDTANEHLAAWMMRMNLVMGIDEEKVLQSLVVDDQNIDGTVLQLTTFVLQEFLATLDKNPPFENLQQLAAAFLQSLFQPAMHARMERRLAEVKTDEDDE